MTRGFIRSCHVAALLALAACSSPAPDPEVLRKQEEQFVAKAAATRQSALDEGNIIIGVAAPLSGDLQAYGAELRRGAELAVADLNAAGGVTGRTLQLEVVDDECGIEKAEAAARDLMSRGVVFVDGHFCSGSSIRGSKVYSGAGILQITPSSTNDLLTDNAARSKVTTLLRVVGRDSGQADLAADRLLALGSPIAVLSDNSLYGKGIAARLLMRLEEKGVKPDIAGEFNQGQLSYSGLIAKMKEVKPKAIYVAAYHDDIGRLAWAIRTAGLETEIIGPDALNSTEFWGYARGRGNGVRYTDFAPAIENPAAADLIARLAANGEQAGNYTLQSYAAVQVFAAAAEATGGVDAAKIGAYLRTSSVKTILGELHWDAKGDLVSPSEISPGEASPGDIWPRYIWYVWQEGQPRRE